MVNYLPEDVIIHIIDKLYLCKFHDNSNIATVSKKWNYCTKISIRNCSKYKYFGENEVCVRHSFSDIY